MAARTGPKPRLETADLLQAVSTLGIRWTMLFADEEISVVNTALDRELLNGNLANAFTVSAQGEQLLERVVPLRSGLKLDIRIDAGCLGCRLDDVCWTIRCLRCDDLQLRHVREAGMVDQVRQVLSTHECHGRTRPGGERS